jgi:3'-phosphoadenosine 5'-phosphosulfate sulfotransferase (PAPS reductase)/FAD synthetase
MLCALKDILQRPRARGEFKWDMLVHGQRNVDRDPAWGAMTLAADVGLQPESASFVFPLRHWTDADIWAYTDFHCVPQNYDRYRAQKDGTYVDCPSKRWNSDYQPACTACMKKGGGVVFCPRLGVDVSNVSAHLPWQQPQQFSYS